jgi:hypothetical protein
MGCILPSGKLGNIHRGNFSNCFSVPICESPCSLPQNMLIKMSCLLHTYKTLMPSASNCFVPLFTLALESLSSVSLISSATRWLGMQYPEVTLSIIYRISLKHCTVSIFALGSMICNCSSSASWFNFAFTSCSCKLAKLKTRMGNDHGNFLFVIIIVIQIWLVGLRSDFPGNVNAKLQDGIVFGLIYVYVTFSQKRNNSNHFRVCQIYICTHDQTETMYRVYYR